PRESRGRNKRSYYPDSGSIAGQGLLAPAIINEAQIQLTEDEYELLKLGPRFIYNNPKTASRRRTIELASLKRKIEARFFEKKVSPGRSVEQFIAELDLVLQKLHNASITNQQHIRKDLINTSIQNLSNTIQLSQRQSGSSRFNIKKKEKNCGRLVKRLKYKLKLTNIIIRKSEKNEN
ncbi:unnamed protein product, partial [Rotaria sordida]